METHKTSKTFPEDTALSQADDKHYVTEQLFGQKKEILILHKGTSYRLRITRQEKLILTK